MAHAHNESDRIVYDCCGREIQPGGLMYVDHALAANGNGSTPENLSDAELEALTAPDSEAEKTADQKAEKTGKTAKS